MITDRHGECNILHTKLHGTFAEHSIAVTSAVNRGDVKAGRHMIHVASNQA